MKMRHLNKTFFSFLLSYLIAMMIPMGILGYISHEYFLDYFTQSLRENKVSTLINIKNSLDIQISQMHSYANRISAKREYTTNYQKLHFSQFYDICTSLAELRYSNDFLSDLQLINNELGYIYTPETRYTFHSYADYGPAWSAYSKQDVEELFLDLSGPVWLPVQQIRDKKEVLTYIMPIFYANDQVMTAAVFQVSEDTLMKIAGASLPSSDSQFLIADHYNNILYSSTGDMDSMPDYFWEKLADTGSGSPVTMTLRDGDSIVYRFFSEASDLQYICVIDYEEIVSPIYTLQTAFLIGIFVVILLGGVAICIFMKRNYGPIRSLSRISKEMLPDSPKDLNDLETLELAMTTMIQNSRDVTDKNNQLVREKLLLNLLRNHIDNPQEFTEQCQNVDIFLEGPSYRIAVLSYKPIEGTSNLYERINLFISGAFPSEIELYTLEYTEDHSVILIFSGESKEIRSLDATLEEMAGGLKVFLPEFNIGLSGVYTSVEESCQAFRQAISAARYTHSNTGAAVSKYEPANSDDLNSVYPTNNINALYNAILSGNTSRIEFAIDMLIPYFNNVGSAFFSVCMGYDIINTALRAMRSLDYPYFEFTKKYPELLLKTGFHSTDEIVNLIKMLCMEICAYVEQADPDSPPQSEEELDSIDNLHEILDFIKQNYTDQGFSAKVLADHFNMSISNFSHYFKKRTGKVVSSYISSLRYEHAKELLRTSDLSVVEISERSGYCHVSTFMRQFKSNEKVTPGIYRIQYRFAAEGSKAKND